MAMGREEPVRSPSTWSASTCCTFFSLAFELRVAARARGVADRGVDVVFVAGCEEGLLPHYYCSNSEEEVEQERRLLYVAMTRAKQRLVLTHTGVRARWGKVTPVERSRFLQALPQEIFVEVEPPPRASRWRRGGRRERW